MSNSNLKIIFRRLVRNKLFTTIQTAGLAISFTACILIYFYVENELSYDKFHKDAENIYRIYLHSDQPQPRTPHPMAQAMVNDFPEVNAAVSLSPIWGSSLNRALFTVEYLDNRFEEGNVFMADSTFLDVFSFPVKQGDINKALKEPYQIIITESIAKKYFNDENPIGKQLTFNDETDVEVGAVLYDLPPNSHFHFDFLVSYVTMKKESGWPPFFEWGDFGHYNYVKLNNGADKKEIENRMGVWIKNYIQVDQKFDEDYKAGRIGLRLQPITDIHLQSNLNWELEPNGNITYIQILIGAAIFIFVIAIVNFINITTARSGERSLETGIRKLLGADRKKLVQQLISESLIISVFSTILAIVLVELLSDWFSVLKVNVSLLHNYSWFVLLILGLLVGLIAGAYPAYFLSGTIPINALKNIQFKGHRGIILRKTLVVVQFTLSVIMIGGTFLIYNQLNFLLNKDLGFDKEQVLSIPFKDDNTNKKYEMIKSELKQNANIISVSAVSNVPGSNFNKNQIQLEGNPDWYTANELRVDEDFFETMNINLTNGRNFAKTRPADLKEKFIINETTADYLGITDFESKQIHWYDEHTTWKGNIIGITEDFHFQSLHFKISPLIIQYNPDYYTHLLVKINREEIQSTLSFIEQKWQEIEPGHLFEYHFMDQQFEDLYQEEKQLSQLFGIFSIMAIFIACLGLFGLAVYSLEKRIKEISVRKIMGASIWQILTMLIREYIILVFAAIIVGIPVTYLLISDWLSGFPYKIIIDPMVFVFSGLIAIVIAVVTVAYHSVKAALTNPVDTLKYE